MSKVEEQEITLDGKKIKIVTKMPKDMIEENPPIVDLDDTIELQVIKESTNE